MGLLIMGRHYFCYPLMTWFFISALAGTNSQAARRIKQLVVIATYHAERLLRRLNNYALLFDGIYTLCRLGFTLIQGVFSISQ